MFRAESSNFAQLYVLETLARIDRQTDIISMLKVKVKVHTLDIAPLRSESPQQKRSGMARVLKGFRSFTCTPARKTAKSLENTCHT